MSQTTKRFAFPSIEAAESFLAKLSLNGDAPLETHAIFAPTADGGARLTIVLTPEQADRSPELLIVTGGAPAPEEVAPTKLKEVKVQTTTAKPVKAPAEKSAEGRCPTCQNGPYKDVAKHVAKRHPAGLVVEEGHCPICLTGPYKDVAKHQAKRHA